ncbi:MAG TPA: hypothetical protein VL595_25550, partial [Pseudonocardia sp.]|nr:hypothetical protein [Pseudonocardia sp.]
MRGAGRMAYSATTHIRNSPSEIRTRELSDPSAALRRQWDALVASSGYPDVSQLSGWAQVRAGAGYRPLY